MVASRLAVIGDVHSNVLALKASLQSIADCEANESPVDVIVFIGDLLTYGIRPTETLSEVLELCSSRQTVFVMGNHDRLYADLITGSSLDYYATMPDWVKESVDYNLCRLDEKLFLGIDFLPFYSHASVIFSHANFSALVSEFIDWKYINSFDDHLEQLKIISEAGYSLGVLGHTHRSRCYSMRQNVFDGLVDCDNRKINLDAPLDFDDYSCSIVNAGSIGQPREKCQLIPSWLLVELDNSLISSTKFVSFDYDIGAHVKSISDSGLSAYCIQKLVSFF